MIDRMFDHAARILEIVLAVALIIAVLLNFGNVIGRFVLGVQVLGADEVQIYIMVGLAFLGAAVVTWRREHLRMDVLAQRFPRPIRLLLNAIELLLIAVLAGMMVVLSLGYAERMFAIGRVSEMADIPMWIPHGALAIGFGLILVVAVRRILRAIGHVLGGTAKDDAQP